jgi:hypothetical protein
MYLQPIIDHLWTKDRTLAAYGRARVSALEQTL